MSGLISLGPTSGGITVSGRDGGKVEATGNAGRISLTNATPNGGGGSSLSSYQRALISGYGGTESEFYEGLAASASDLNDVAPNILDAIASMDSQIT